MRIEQLKFFLELSRAHSYHIAADRLSITQQALSSSIKSLEKEFQTQLLNRSRSGCTLTSEGEIFLNYAQKSLDDYERMTSYLTTRNSQPKENSGNCIDIIFANSFLSTCSSAAISEFSKKFPRIQINIKMIRDERLSEYVQRTTASNYLIFQTIPFDVDERPMREYMPEGADVHLIKKSYYIACVSKNSILADIQEASLHTLLDFPLVLAIEADQNTTPIHNLLNRYKSTNLSMTTPSFFTWSQAVADNIGIGFTQELFLERENIRKIIQETTHCIRLHEKIGAYLGVTFPEHPNDAVRNFFEMMRTSTDERFSVN